MLKLRRKIHAVMQDAHDLPVLKHRADDRRRQRIFSGILPEYLLKNPPSVRIGGQLVKENCKMSHI